MALTAMHNNSSFLVSVIIPAYNAELTILKTLKSLQTQYYSNFEALVIDDGSTDNTASYISDFCDSDKRFRLLSKTNGGIADALNFGLERVRGAYVARLDADDIACREWLSEMLSFLSANPLLDVASCGYVTFGSSPGRTVLHPGASDSVQLLLCYCSPVSHPGAVWRFENLKTFRYDVNSVAEDHNLWCDIVESGFKIGNFDKVLIKYRIHQKSLSFAKRRLIRSAVYRRGASYFFRQFRVLATLDISSLFCYSKNYPRFRIWPAVIYYTAAKIMAKFMR